MSTLTLLPRILHIAGTAARYRLDDLVEDARVRHSLRTLRWFLPSPPAEVLALPRGERFAISLTALGPIFVKFGQILSTRRDLLPLDISDALTALQDRVAPFPGEQARAMVERELGAPINELYADFDETPLASASIAQVHAARMHDGREVVVKVLRPDIRKRIQHDVELLRALGGVADRWHPNADKIRPLDVVAEVESTLLNELDLQREGANASLLRRNFANSPDLIVPAVEWDRSSERVLTLQRLSGIPVDDIVALDAAGIDRKRLARKGVEMFYTQVFRDNFFHADAHAGNIWVDPSNPTDPAFIALDFGIMGALPDADLYWLAENFLALFDRDYRRIAELHLRAGWMPTHVRTDELEAAVRAVCEPYFTRPLAEISLAEVVVKLFQTARRYELTLQPQLILLQKTLLNIEGIGRLLDPQIDIWAVAQPILDRIWRQRRSPRRILAKLRRRMPEWIGMAPEIPQLVHQALGQLAAGRVELVTPAADQKRLDARANLDRRAAAWRWLGAIALLTSAWLWTSDRTLVRWHDMPIVALVGLGIGLFAFFQALRR